MSRAARGDEGHRMKLVDFDNVRHFADRAMRFLAECEAERCVELGILDGLLNGRSAAHRGVALEKPLLWLVEDSRGQVHAVAMQSVVNRMLVSRGPIEAMHLIAQKLSASHWPGQQINGIEPAINEFVDEFARASGREARRTMQLRTFQLDRVIPPRAAPGRARLADETDRDLLRRWTLAFVRSVGDDVPDTEGGRMAGNLIDGHRGWIWQNNGPVAMAAHAGPTPNGIRVNAVYTPSEHRGNGYASNLVAAISQHHLNAGKRFVFLHTDLANRTSNSIYQKIGYVPVADSERWDFAPA